MTDKIKNFFSTAFAVVAVICMGYGCYKIPSIGLDKASGYIAIGAVFSFISIFIEYSRAQNYDGDDF